MGCNVEEKGFAEQYDGLIKENDRIEQVHSNFKNSREELIQNHQEVMQQMESMEIEDSTNIMECRPGHEKMLQG